MTDDNLAAWRETFIAEYGIDRGPLDEGVRSAADETRGHPGNAATRPPTTQDRIPERYSGALTTEPAVCAWMADLTRQALQSRRVTVAITTGPSLLVLGPTGTGKTHQAYGVIRGFDALGVRARWRVTTAADLYARLRPRHGVDSEAVFDDYAHASLLVVDDFGAAKNTEWTEDVNTRLVNHRYERVLPTLFTSNLTPAELADRLGGRVSSRLKEMADRVVLKGSDRRYREDAA